jgi:MFS family permease
MVVGAVVCGYVTAAFGWTAPWLLCAGLFAATGITGALLMREPPRAAQPVGEHHRHLLRTIRRGMRTVRDTPLLIVLYVLTLAGAFAAFPFLMLWQRRVETLVGGEPLALIGWLTAAWNVAALIGSALLPRLLGRFARETVLCAASFWRAAMIMVAAATTSLTPVVAALFLQAVSPGITDPVLTAWTNEHVAAAERATVLSVRSVFFTFGGAAGLVCLGFVARGYGIPVAWAIAAVVFALMAPAFLTLGRMARAADANAASEPVPPLPTKITPAA